MEERYGSTGGLGHSWLLCELMLAAKGSMLRAEYWQEVAPCRNGENSSRASMRWRKGTRAVGRSLRLSISIRNPAPSVRSPT